MIKTAVIILNWNGIGWLQKFLETAVRFSKRSDTELYLADNGSTDGSVDHIKRNFPDVEILSLDTNLGFGFSVWIFESDFGSGF